jgi:hypothetical protein
MCDQDAHAGKVLVAKLSPQALVEATDAVVCIGSTLAVGNAIEEVAVVGALLPHALHFGGTWLEVAKVLLAQAGLFEDLDLVTGEGRGQELDRVIRLEERTELPSCIFGLVVRVSMRLSVPDQCHCGAYLGDAVRRQLHAVVGDELVDVAVLVALGLRVADQDDHLDPLSAPPHPCGYTNILEASP